MKFIDYNSQKKYPYPVVYFTTIPGNKENS